jgi:hypothetical protein
MQVLPLWGEKKARTCLRGEKIRGGISPEHVGFLSPLQFFSWFFRKSELSLLSITFHSFLHFQLSLALSDTFDFCLLIRAMQQAPTLLADGGVPTVFAARIPCTPSSINTYARTQLQSTGSFPAGQPIMEAKLRCSEPNCTHEKRWTFYVFKEGAVKTKKQTQVNETAKRDLLRHHNYKHTQEGEGEHKRMQIIPTALLRRQQH